MPGRELGEEDALAASHGVAVAGTAPADEPVRLTHEHRLIAIARPDGSSLKPFVVFPA
jgi:hypothetical protein